MDSCQVFSQDFRKHHVPHAPTSQLQEQQRVQHTPTPGSDPLGKEPAPAWLPTARHLEAFSRGLSCGGCQQGRWIGGDR